MQQKDRVISNRQDFLTKCQCNWQKHACVCVSSWLQFSHVFKLKNADFVISFMSYGPNDALIANIFLLRAAYVFNWQLKKKKSEVNICLIPFGAQMKKTSLTNGPKDWVSFYSSISHVFIT